MAPQHGCRTRYRALMRSPRRAFQLDLVAAVLLFLLGLHALWPRPHGGDERLPCAVVGVDDPHLVVFCLSGHAMRSPCSDTEKNSRLTGGPLRKKSVSLSNCCGQWWAPNPIYPLGHVDTGAQMPSGSRQRVQEMDHQPPRRHGFRSLPIPWYQLNSSDAYMDTL